MDAIEKRALELFEASRGLYNATIGDPAVTIRCQSGAARDAVAAAGERLRLALLDQRPALIPADDQQVVTSSAPGAHEVQPEAVDVGLDLAEPGERLAAADALEHDPGIRPEGDGQATADHVAHDLKMVERARALLAEELRARYPDDIASRQVIRQLLADELDLINARVAVKVLTTALTPPEGCVPERSVLVAATHLRRLASAATPMARSAYIKAAEMVEMAVIAARPEVPS